MLVADHVHLIGVLVAESAIPAPEPLRVFSPSVSLGRSLRPRPVGLLWRWPRWRRWGTGLCVGLCGYSHLRVTSIDPVVAGAGVGCTCRRLRQLFKLRVDEVLRDLRKLRVLPQSRYDGQQGSAHLLLVLVSHLWQWRKVPQKRAHVGHPADVLWIITEPE